MHSFSYSDGAHLSLTKSGSLIRAAGVLCDDGIQRDALPVEGLPMEVPGYPASVRDGDQIVLGYVHVTTESGSPFPTMSDPTVLRFRTLMSVAAPG